MKRKDLDAEMEQLEALGQDSEKKSVPVVAEVMKASEKKKQDEDSKTLETLHKGTKSTFVTYYRLLATLLTRMLQTIEWPRGWEYEVKPTDKGVVERLRFKDHYYQSAFKPTGLEKYDKAAVEAFVVRTENTVERVMKQYDIPQKNT